MHTEFMLSCVVISTSERIVNITVTVSRNVNYLWHIAKGKKNTVQNMKYTARHWHRSHDRLLTNRRKTQYFVY
jgi:hypothetical protein